MNKEVRYQVMPPLSPDEYQELYEDIKTNGILVPVIEDEDGVIIDGHHRSKIASELGIPCPIELVDGKSDAEKRGMAFTLNLKRRHLNREQRRALIAKSLKKDPELSNREHARRTGASTTTVGTVRNELIVEGQVSKLDTSTGSDGKSYPASQPPRPKATAIPQTDLDALNEPRSIPNPVAPPPVKNEDDERPTVETEQQLMVELMNRLNKAHREVQEATYIANKLTTWPGAPLSDDIRTALDELDAALKSGGMDAQLKNLIEGNK